MSGRNRVLSNALFTILGATFCIVATAAFAAAPRLINLQGILTDSSGNPMPNTGYGVTFRIYTAASGGTVVWTEETAVYTSNGLFTVVLGNQTPVSDTVFNNPDRWLGIQMDDYPEMTPRSRLTSVAYANQTAQWNSDGENLYRLNGSIGIGTESPSRAFASPSALSLSSSGGEGLIEIIRTGSLVDGMAIGQYDWTIDDNTTLKKQVLAIRGDVSGSTPGDRGASMVFFTKADGGAIFDRMYITSTGNVGIGTALPAAKLEVRGDIRLGPTGQYRATSGVENLRIVRGSINGAGVVVSGTGYQVTHPGLGQFVITYDTPFSATPSITATSYFQVAAGSAMISASTVSSATINLCKSTSEITCQLYDSSFDFIAIGPR